MLLEPRAWCLLPSHGREGEIGGNRILVETPEGAWFCDFGTRFKLAGRFYEEFLKPRASSLGIHDFLRIGLLPPLEGIYRDDLWAYEPDLWDRYRNHPTIVTSSASMGSSFPTYASTTPD